MTGADEVERLATLARQSMSCPVCGGEPKLVTRKAGIVYLACGHHLAGDPGSDPGESSCLDCDRLYRPGVDGASLLRCADCVQARAARRAHKWRGGTR